ncbi:MAG: ABC-type multidrug/protein/lipid transport system ATPase component [Bacillota bacterium]
MRDFAEHHESRQDRKVILRFFAYLKPHLKTFILAFVLMIIGTFTGMILPLASGLAIDQMQNPGLTLEDKLWIVGIGTVVLLITSGLSTYVSYVQSIMLQKVGQKITHEIRHQVYDHINTLSIGQINQLPVGKLVTRATNDPANISDMFTNTLINIIRSGLSMLIIGGILFAIHPFMTLVTLSVLPLIYIASQMYRKAARGAYRDVRNKVSELNAFLSEHLSGMKVVQVFNQEKKIKQSFHAINRQLRNSSLKEMYTFAIYRPSLYFLTMLATLIAIFVGVQSVLSGAITIGLFVSFYVYVGQFFEPIQQISEQLNTLQSSFASAEKIFDVLDTKPDLVDDVDAMELKTLKGKVEFKDVWFSYLPNEWVLKGVSFKILPNETVAFVGATGSGKTTILQLIVRNYDIQKGEILIDDIPIQKIKRSSLRKFIGQMLQDVFLFSGTIEDNITLQNPDITEAKIKEASQYVGLNYVIAKRTEGLKYQVKERGKNFSSGERQLISFARALVYQPSLMILDEATANIDSETETVIQASLEKMMNISTMIIVAHRLSTIQHSDRIIVMQKGEIKESGTHQELLKQRGLYYNLYLLQYDQKLD